jgi:hypothetical protein
VNKVIWFVYTFEIKSLILDFYGTQCYEHMTCGFQCFTMACDLTMRYVVDHGNVTPWTEKLII